MGVEVEHFCARDKNGEKLTYEKLFYHIPQRKHPKNAGGFTAYNRDKSTDGQMCGYPGATGTSKCQPCNRPEIYGFPMVKGGWCKRLKVNVIHQGLPNAQGAQRNIVQCIGIAADEPERIERHIKKPGVKLPLVEAGWTEAMCREWCEKNGLLAPIYTTATRGGCWFCHNQGVGQLRLLRKQYPEYWALMLKWDADSPIPFHPPIRKMDGTIEPGKTVHDFDRRFQMEDAGVIDPEATFRWKMINQTYLGEDTP